ncbi:MAG: sigma-70 family RNA polymerase sigma factor [bacterium]
MGQILENLSDEELFQLLKVENEDTEKAFTELYNRYSPHIYAYCRRFLGNKEAAEDVFQETFLNFHQGSKKLSSMTNAKGYILSIARNLCYNYFRTEKLAISSDDYSTIINDDRSENDELLDLIKRAIELMPEEYRELFILREYDGMSYTEIADITKSNVNTVKVKLFRAKQKLRKILEPYIQDLSNYE